MKESKTDTTNISWSARHKGDHTVTVEELEKKMKEIEQRLELLEDFTYHLGLRSEAVEKYGPLLEKLSLRFPVLKLGIEETLKKVRGELEGWGK